MKIKVARVAENSYNIYYGFSGIPITFPFHTVWKLDKENITREEASKCISKYALDCTKESVLKC